MCGIAGYFELNDAPAPSPELAQRMLAQIRHRGPDEFGVFVGDRIAMGNARLSIVDLAGGTQPICNESGEIWIVYNGEVFNYPELRATLEQRGHVFATHTDTEIIVHLYEDFGPACLEKLNGQWAIAIWDARKQELFIARDRLGVRPLFYTVADGTLVFGSEIKALFAHPKVRRALDPQGIAQVFNYWTAVSPHTCFDGVRELPPGHYAVVRNQTPEPKAYWKLDFSEQRLGEAQSAKGSAGSAEIRKPVPLTTSPSASEAASQLRDLLIDAARIRLRADVPVGAYLSGGLDSSIIAAITRHIGVQKLDTFSIAFDDPAFDESGPQREMARFLGTEHQVVRATHADIGEVFPDVIWHTEMPLTRTAPVPMFLLSRLVHDRHYRVVLTGEGADEFLAGYDIFKEAAIRRFWAREPESIRRPQLLRRLYPDIARLDSAPAFVRGFFGAGLTETAAPDYSHRIRWRNNARGLRFLNPGVGANAGEAGIGGALAYPPEFSRWHPLAQAQYIEATVFLSGYLLSSQGDRMAMAHAVEGRYPFLDYRVVEFCNSLPASMKLNGLREKWILREAFKGWLPEPILQRRKRPYRAPIHRSFATGGGTGYVDELLIGSGAKSGMFNPLATAKLHQALRAQRPMGETDEMALVGIISTELLHRRFIIDFNAASALRTSDRVKLVDRRTGAVAAHGGR